jgi:hypothetical protein
LVSTAHSFAAGAISQQRSCIFITGELPVGIARAGGISPRH